MPVAVIVRARRRGCRARAVGADARSVLRAMGEPAAEMTVVLADDSVVHDLNRRYRGKDRPADVLAFAAREGQRLPGDEKQVGDVVISLDTASRQAAQRGRTLAEEVRTLLIHGVLHLLGYDHERSASEARRMRAKERELAVLLDGPRRAKRR